MNWKRLLALPLLTLLPLLLSSVAQANVTPKWIEGTDLDGDKKNDLIFVGNTHDVAFNERGEILGWYVKPITGTAIVNEGSTPPNIDGLKSQRQGSLTSGQTVMVVGGLEGNLAEAVAETPRIRSEGDPNKPDKLYADFRYRLGDQVVSKEVVITPYRFTLELNVNVTGADRYTLEFAGLNNSGGTQLKAVPKNSQQVINSGEVQNIQYAGLFLSGVWWNPVNSGAALIVQPISQNPISATLTPGGPAKYSLSMSGENTLRVYGGRNELVGLKLEGYYELPGLFDPNIWGRLSILLIDLMNAVHGVVGSWVLTLVLITILIRLAVWPLLHRQYLSTAEMQMVQPLMKELNEKYKDNPERRTQETMRLYQEHKINPAAGCLPAIVQIPIFFVMWRVPYYFQFNEGFLWVRDLALPDPIWLIPLLYVGVSLLNLWIMTRKTPEMFRQQAFIYIIIAFFALQFPSGAAIYFIVSTLVGVFQYWLINKQIARKMELRNVQVVPPASGGSSGKAGGSGSSVSLKK